MAGTAAHLLIMEDCQHRDAAALRRLQKALEAGEDPDALTRKLLENPPEVITLDEAGCGIVPIEREKRIYREAVGRVGQLLAARAEKVYRVQCGIAVRIK